MESEVEFIAKQAGIGLNPVFSDDLVQAAEVIRNGGVVVCPAEGVYGLSCNALNEEAVARVVRIKERDSAKGLITIASSLHDLEQVADFKDMSCKGRTLINKLWPGPYTFVVPCANSFRGSLLTGGRGSVAVRITAFETLANLVRLSGVPLISTSANLSGEQAVSSFDLLSPVILKRVDFVLTLPCGGLSGSTSVYDTLSDVLLRKGPQWPEDLS